MKKCLFFILVLVFSQSSFCGGCFSRSIMERLQAGVHALKPKPKTNYAELRVKPEAQVEINRISEGLGFSKEITEGLLNRIMGSVPEEDALDYLKKLANSVEGADPNQLRRFQRLFIARKAIDTVPIDRIMAWVRNRRLADEGYFDNTLPPEVIPDDADIVTITRKKEQKFWDGDYPDGVNDILSSPFSVMQSMGSKSARVLGFRFNSVSRHADIPTATTIVKKRNEYHDIAPENLKPVINFKITKNEVEEGVSYLKDYYEKGLIPMGEDGRIFVHDMVAHGDNFLIPKEYVVISQKRMQIVDTFLGSIAENNPSLYKILSDMNQAAITPDELRDDMIGKLDAHLGNYRKTVRNARENPKTLFVYNNPNFLFSPGKPSEFLMQEIRQILPEGHAMREELLRLARDFADNSGLDAGYDPSIFNPETINRRVVEMADAFGETMSR